MEESKALQLIGSVNEQQAIAKWSEDMHRSGWLPQHYKSPAQVSVAVQYGKELGVPPLTAIRNTHFINGMMGISAHLMVAVIRKSGVCEKFQVEELTSEKCSIYGKRTDTGEEWTEVYTMEDAAQAGLLKVYRDGKWIDKDNWKKLPKDMLYARAASRLCRRLWSDVLSGATYSAEELEDKGDDIVVREIKEEKTEPIPPVVVEEKKKKGRPKKDEADKQEQKLAEKAVEAELVENPIHALEGESVTIEEEEGGEEIDPPTQEVVQQEAPPPAPPVQTKGDGKPTMKQISRFFALIKAVEKKDINYNSIKKQFGIESINKADNPTYDKICNWLIEQGKEVK